MENKFDSRAFIKDIAKDLVSNFDGAAKATTPGLKGAARENAVRKKLEYLLPSGIGVGTGCVIDHEGRVSKQQDVVLYEKNICPIFSINDTPETTYYPCEGVIAVGEIKTSIGKAEIEDCFSKIESVKKLRRLALKSKSALLGYEVVSFRKYGNMVGFDCSKDEQFDQENNPYDQIYGFVLCGNFSVAVETLCGHILNQLKIIDKSNCPNIIVSLNEGIFAPHQKANNKLYYSMSQADSLLYGSSSSGSFEYLLTTLYKSIRSGRTVESSVFERYLIDEPNKMTLTIDRIIDCP
jgi:hypothetical protein